MKTIRDGQKVWPYCSECGCRLDLNYTPSFLVGKEVMIQHFGRFSSSDARGCRCSKLNDIHFTSRDTLAPLINLT